METTDGQKESNSGKGCLRAVLIVFLGIIALIAAVAAILLILSTPGRRQIARLEGGSAAGAPPPLPENGAGMVVDIPQAALSAIFDSAFSDAVNDIPGVEFIGADILLNEDEIDILAGISGRLPALRWKKKATVGFRADVVTRDDGIIAITPTKVSVCRFRLPVKRFFICVDRIPGIEEALSAAESRGIRLDAEARSVYADPAFLADVLPPGTEPKGISILPGHIRIVLEVPKDLEDSVGEALSTVKASRADLLARLGQAIPGNGSGFVGSVEALLAEENDVSEAMNGALKAVAAFGGLAPEEQEAVLAALEAYFRDHPEVLAAMNELARSL